MGQAPSTVLTKLEALENSKDISSGERARECQLVDLLLKCISKPEGLQSGSAKQTKFEPSC